MQNFKILARTATLPFKKNLLPQTLNLFVTARCNAKCDFCLYKHSVDNPTVQSLELSITEYERIAENYGPLHFLSVSGGEPFIRNDLAEICQVFIDRCDVQAVDIPSNFFYTKQMVAVMEKLVTTNPAVRFELQLSVDHTDERHDEVRGIKGLFERVQETLRALSSLRDRKNFTVKGNGLFLDSNENELEFLAAWFENVAGCDRFNLSFPQQLLKASTENDKVVMELDKYIQAVSMVMDNAAFTADMDLLTSAILASKRLSRKRLYEAAKGTRDTGSYCEAGKSIVVLDQEGNVFPCEPLWESIGNIREYHYSLRDVLGSDKYQKFRNLRLGQGKCNCTWTCAINSASAMNVMDAVKIGVDGFKSVLLKRKS